ncbi:MAG: SoxR reducing system RseC family protein [Clostridiales bacterium]|nr:SoxR reducing system RseC family protein [Clostridiales bacterium]
MAKIGKVVKLEYDVAVISMKANAGCGDCNACALGSDDSDQVIDAINNIGALIGDTVEFDMEISSLLGAAFIAYIIPFITMVGSITLSIYFKKQINFNGNIELNALIIGFVTLLLTLVVIRLFDGKMKKSKRFMAKINKVVIKSNQEVFLNDRK